MTPAAPLAFQILGAPARLAQPDRLWLLVAVALLALLGAVQLVRRRALLTRSTGELGPRVAPTAGTARPAGRLGLSLLGLALLALALARPQCGTRTELTRRFGADVAIALDVSRSMQARDVAPDRLTRAKLEVGALLDRLAGDRVAVVVFAGEAFVQCPLTSDYDAARLFLRSVGPGSVPQQGSDLGNALRAAREVLGNAEAGGARSKVVLLVSDGEDLEGGAVEAAGQLADAGYRIYALGVGRPVGEPIPIADAGGAVSGYRKDRRGETIVTRLDEATLRAVVEKGHGELFEVGSPDRGPAGFITALDGLAKSELTQRLTVQYEDRYALFAYPAFLALLAALLLREGRTPREMEEAGTP